MTSFPIHKIVTLQNKEFPRKRESERARERERETVACSYDTIISWLYDRINRQSPVKSPDIKTL